MREIIIQEFGRGSSIFGRHRGPKVGTFGKLVLLETWFLIDPFNPKVTLVLLDFLTFINHRPHLLEHLAKKFKKYE